MKSTFTTSQDTVGFGGRTYKWWYLILAAALVFLNGNDHRFDQLLQITGIIQAFSEYWRGLEVLTANYQLGKCHILQKNILARGLVSKVFDLCISVYKSDLLKL